LLPLKFFSILYTVNEDPHYRPIQLINKMAPRQTYSSTQLHEIRSSYVTEVDKKLRNTLFKNRIWKPKSNKNRPFSTPPKITIPLNIGVLNTRSAVHKAALLHDLIQEYNLDVLSLTETWITSDAPDAVKLDVAPPGYSVIHQHRGAYHDKRGGGIAFVHRNNIQCEIFPTSKIAPPQTTYHEFESLIIKITNTSQPITIAIIYRPPDTNITNFITELANFIDNLSHHQNILICGDFNASNSPHSINDKLQNLIDELNLTQHIKSSTHVSNHILDLLISRNNTPNLVSEPSIHPTIFSDHYQITTSISISKPISTTTTSTYRNINKIDWAQFDMELSNTILDNNNLTADQYLQHINNITIHSLDKYAPIKTKVSRKSENTHHKISNEAAKAKRLRRKMEKKYFKNKNPSNKIAYDNAKKVAREAIINSRISNINEEIISSKNPRCLWRNLNKLLHRHTNQQIISDNKCKELVHSFNNFFIDKINNIHQNINNLISSQSSPLQTFQHRTNTKDILASFHSTTPSEIKQIIINSCNKSSPLDPFPHQVFLYCNSLSIALSQLINMSFEEGHFPSSLKTAQILPLIKKPNLDDTLPSNFRPISNLSTLSKIIERTALKRLQPHITSNPNYSNLQSAYRSNHSTETALLHVLDHAFNACDSKKVTVLACLDLSAAFDTISHSILIDRLDSEFGITGKPLQWISSYLSGRSQFVKLGTHSSASSPLVHGVPQGSVLGPLLFTTYISPVGQIINDANISHHQYADDTQLFQSFTHNDHSQNINTLTHCIKTVHNWFLQNNLQLNSSKTDIIMLGTPYQLNRSQIITSIDIDNTPIPISNSLKSLGVILDTKLTFSNYITSTIQTCNHHLRAIKHIRPFITDELSSNLIRCLVITRLDYCNSILFNTSQHQLSRLQSVMNRAARVALNVNSPHHYLTHSSSVNLIKLHWLPIIYRIQFKIACITYKTLTTSSPSYLHRLISVKAPTRHLRSTASITLSQQRTTNNISQRAFRHTAPKVWNSLPQNITNCKQLSSFKSKLKTHFFKLAFPASAPDM